MASLDDGISVTAWKNLKQRLSFKGLGGCCGATRWATTRAQTLPIDIDQEEEEEQGEEPIMQTLAQMIRSTDQSSATTVTTTTTPAGMNLAMALAAERNSRVQNANVIPAKSNGGPIKTLMRLIEETDGVDWMMNTKGRDSGDKEDEGVRVRGNVENDWVCCVCMERNKGAAFIPCGHAYCRICSRELWANRGSCPICNRSILEVLDIF